jgi:hypothetical protein
MTAELPAQEDKKAPPAPGVAGTAIPASLKAEYEELSLKRNQLRADLQRARAELAGLKAKRNPL